MITILLSTYNGEQYLEAQLQSLTTQEGVESQIVVRDDGSSDSTCEILERWQSQSLLRWSRGERVGFARSFMLLLRGAPPSQYYAFCDQDDIWLPNKLLFGVEAIARGSKPMLYCSNLRLFDGVAEGRLMHPLSPTLTLARSLVSSVATGCTMLFNAPLREILLGSEPRRLVAHDLWTYHTATLLGEVHYDPRAYILYRQHGGNEIGGRGSLKERWSKRMRSLRRLECQHYREVEARELLSCYRGLLEAKQVESLRCVALYRESFWTRVRLLFSRSFVAQSLEATLWVKVRIILGYL